MNGRDPGCGRVLPLEEKELDQVLVGLLEHWRRAAERSWILSMWLRGLGVSHTTYSYVPMLTVFQV